MSIDRELFLETLRRKLGEEPTISPSKSWVAGSVRPDGAVVVLYQASVGGPIVGRRWLLEDLSRLFSTEDAQVLASAVYTSEIAEPEGDLRTLSVDWATGLVDNPAEILWAGI